MSRDAGLPFTGRGDTARGAAPHCAAPHYSGGLSCGTRRGAVVRNIPRRGPGEGGGDRPECSQQRYCTVRSGLLPVCERDPDSLVRAGGSLSAGQGCGRTLIVLTAQCSVLTAHRPLP